MNRMSMPTADQTPAASLPLLAAVHKQLGVVPNLMKLVGNSPAALEGYLSLNNALGKGTIGAETGERIALAIAEINGCSYCLSAHTYLGKNVPKLDDAEIAANRNGTSSEAREAPNRYKATVMIRKRFLLLAATVGLLAAPLAATAVPVDEATTAAVQR